MSIKQLRIEKGLTQIQCADFLQIPVRTYKRYEANEEKINRIKYRYIIDKLNEYGLIDEEHGKLTLDGIKNICTEVFKNYSVDYCYLFGSYAKGKATGQSDVDLLISTKETGLRFYEIAERLRESLHKKVDLLDVKQLVNNETLIDEMLKEGIKIYG